MNASNPGDIVWPGGCLSLRERVYVMGILNVTPDSFSDGGLHADPDDAVDSALRMIEEGADIIDVGGESTRPGSADVAEDEEIRRVVPVIKRVRAQTEVPISIDTRKAAVARGARNSREHIVKE